MNTFTKRVVRLERHHAPKFSPDYLQNPTSHMRIVASAAGRTVNLETSTCKRLLTESGALSEVVILDGAGGDITEDALEQFVQSFPVKRI
jgi:hypothetical protein